jgi:hypothetical protein
VRIWLNVFLISVKIEMSDTEECLNSLDAWLKIYKNKIYDENIKGDENSKQVLLKYKYSLSDFSEILIDAIENEDIEKLKIIGWPEDLMECVKDMRIRPDLIYKIQHWFVQYPFIKSKIHLQEIEKQNAGIN